jgi:hypothetical protein
MSRHRGSEGQGTAAIDGVSRAAASLASAEAGKGVQPRIVINIDHHLPGTNTGGPVRTAASTVEQLAMSSSSLS